MKVNTKIRKKAIKGFEQAYGRQEIIEKMYQICQAGKLGFDLFIKELGVMTAETIMYIEREERSGPDYRPTSPDTYKWASQAGSVYIGDRKIEVEHPRLRGQKGEIVLQSYQRLKEHDGFSEELLNKGRRGISCQKYKETAVSAAEAFGVSAGSVSRHIVSVTAKRLKEFKERRSSDFIPFAIFIDTINRGGEAFMVCLGIDVSGTKRVLGA